LSECSDKALYIDLELTCWDTQPIPTGQSREIIQIGLVYANLSNLQIINTERYYITVKSEISEYCTNLTAITKDNISSYGKSFKLTLSEIVKKFHPNNKATFAWGDDSSFINDACIQYMCKNPFDNMYDLGVQFKHAFGTNRNHSLPDAMSMLGLSFEGRQHDGLVDAENLCNLHLEMLRRIRGG
jgi:inhibitor of KinA sporulation pathway (predicted exonuclease)